MIIYWKKTASIRKIKVVNNLKSIERAHHETSLTVKSTVSTSRFIHTSMIGTIEKKKVKQRQLIVHQ